MTPTSEDKLYDALRRCSYDEACAIYAIAGMIAPEPDIAIEMQTEELAKVGWTLKDLDQYWIDNIQQIENE